MYSKITSTAISNSRKVLCAVSIVISGCNYTQDEQVCDSEKDEELSLQLVSGGKDLSGWWVQPDHGDPRRVRWALFVDAEQKPRWLGELDARPAYRETFSANWGGALSRFGCMMPEDRPLIIGAKNVTSGRRPLIHTGLVPVPTPMPVQTLLVNSSVRDGKLHLNYAHGPELLAQDPPRVVDTFVFGYDPATDHLSFKRRKMDERLLAREQPQGH